MTRRQHSRRQKQSQGGPTPLAQSGFSSIRNSLPALTPLKPGSAGDHPSQLAKTLAGNRD